MDSKDYPAEWTPLDIHVLLGSGFGVCGCAEYHDVIVELIRLLDWHDNIQDDRASYDTIFSNVGTFYLMAGALDRLGLVEHGTSVRGGWLTRHGEALLRGLRATTADAIENAEGRGFDGLEYGCFG